MSIQRLSPGGRLSPTRPMSSLTTLFHGVAVKNRFCCLLAAALLILAPRPVSAQFDAFKDLFKEVHSVTIYGQTGWLHSASFGSNPRCLTIAHLVCGAGAEVLIDVGKEADQHLELGFGANYLGGVNFQSDSLDLRAAVRSFPTISAYWTGYSNKLAAWYIGGSIGLVELMNAQAYSADSIESTVKGTTFELGPTIGAYRDLGSAAAFIEASYRWRRFSSLDYASGTDTDTLRDWPRSLDLSGIHLSIGMQVHLKSERPSTLPQVWRLTSVDGQSLPAIIGATRRADGSVHTQLLFGMLTLTGDTDGGGYVVQLHTREATMDAGGKLVLLGPVILREESGTFAKNSHGDLNFTPNSPGAGPPPADSVVADGVGGVRPRTTAYAAIQIGDEIRIRDRETGYGLVFRKSGPAPAAAAAKPASDE